MSAPKYQKVRCYIITVLVIFGITFIMDKVSHYGKPTIESLRNYNDSFRESILAVEPFHLAKVFYSYVFYGKLQQPDLKPNLNEQNISSDSNSQLPYYPPSNFNSPLNKPKLTPFQKSLLEHPELFKKPLFNNRLVPPKPTWTAKLTKFKRTVATWAYNPSQEKGFWAALIRIFPGVIYTGITIYSSGESSLIVSLVVLIIGFAVVVLIQKEIFDSNPIPLAFMITPLAGAVVLWLLLFVVFLISFLLGLLLSGVEAIFSLVSSIYLLYWIFHIIVKEREHHFTTKIVDFFTKPN